MSLTKRGKVYWLDIRVGKKRIRRSLRTTKKPEALRKYGQVEDSLIKQYSEERLKFEDFCKQYLEWAWSSKPASAIREEQRLKKIREFFKSLNIIYLEDITPYHIEQLKMELTSRKLSKKTVNIYLQILRFMFYRAIDWELYKKANPLKKVKFYRTDRRRESLSHEQVDRIMESARRISEAPKSELQRQFHDILILATNTGMRKSEILNLKWKDVKEDEAAIIGKGEKPRMIPLNMAARDAITRQKRTSEYIFDLSNREQTNVFRRTIDRIKKETGIEFCFHQFRHVFASSLLEKGVDIVTISEILGHSATSMSLRYSHTDRERKKKAVDLLA